MTGAEVQMLALDEAFLCVECETVGNVAEACPHCGSRALLSLARVLNPESHISSLVLANIGHPKPFPDQVRETARTLARAALELYEVRHGAL